MNGFLETVVADKRREVEALLSAERQAAPQRADAGVRDFAAAIADGGVIAELKRRSPTVESFPRGTDPLAQARIYDGHGAAAISIVTDTPRFGMTLDDVGAVRDATPLPVLVKDFVVDVAQVRAAWAAGADAVLLIARIVDEAALAELHAMADRLGVAALVECHDVDDMRKAARIGARLVGVNTRDLDTLELDALAAREVMTHRPRGALLVAESGLSTRPELDALAALGADAFLVGSALLKADDPARLLDELTGGAR